MEGKSNRKRKKNEHWQPKQPKRPHLEENTLTEITVGKEQASDTDESKKMLHLEENSVSISNNSSHVGWRGGESDNVMSELEFYKKKNTFYRQNR
jgi:hypothetical protein